MKCTMRANLPRKPLEGVEGEVERKVMWSLPWSQTKPKKTIPKNRNNGFELDINKEKDKWKLILFFMFFCNWEIKE